MGPTATRWCSNTSGYGNNRWKSGTKNEASKAINPKIVKECHDKNGLMWGTVPSTELQLNYICKVF